MKVTIVFIGVETRFERIPKNILEELEIQLRIESIQMTLQTLLRRRTPEGKELAFILKTVNYNCSEKSRYRNNISIYSQTLTTASKKETPYLVVLNNGI